MTIEDIPVSRFGYVEFSSAKSANIAMQELNGMELKGRVVRLDVAQSRGDVDAGDHATAILFMFYKYIFPFPPREFFLRCLCCPGRVGANPGPNNKLLISNLSYDTDVDGLMDIFSEANDVYLPKNRETGEKRG